MKQDDEEYSSSSHIKKQLALISFIGFQEHLVINFLKTFMGSDVGDILFFTSFERAVARENLGQMNLTLRKKAIEFIRTTLGNKVQIQIIEMKNIWDFQDYYAQLSKKHFEKAILNISAGPAVFSAAGIIWAMENNQSISYSVEYHNSGELVSSVFSTLDLKPYINSIFSTDRVDKVILESLRAGKNDTLQVHEYLNDKAGFDLSLRSVEIHLQKLYKLGIIDITKGKVNRVSFSQRFLART